MSKSEFCENGFSVRSLLADSRVNDRYYSIPVAQREGTKRQQRELVVEHILKYHPPFPLRFFGLPGEQWSTERMIEENCPKISWPCTYVGVERSFGVIQKSVPWIPGKKSRYFRTEMRRGYIDGLRSTRARVVNFWLKDFLWLGRGCSPRAKNKRKKWSREYRRWTCFWLDSVETVGGPLFKSLVKVPWQCDRAFRVIPFAISFFPQRDTNWSILQLSDSNDPIQRRLDVIKHVLFNGPLRTGMIDNVHIFSPQGIKNYVLVLGRLWQK